MTLISVRLQAPLRKNDIPTFLDCGVAIVSWLEGCIDYYQTFRLQAGTLMTYISSDLLMLWALQTSGLRCQHFSYPARRRPGIESQVNISKVSIYSIFLTNAASRVKYEMNDIKNFTDGLRQ